MINTHMKDTLLPIYRQLTDKEKNSVLRQRLKKADITNDSLSNLIKALEKENFRLKQALKDDDTEERIDGSLYVRAKAFNKLRKRYTELDKRFWEVVAEVNALKAAQNK